MPKLTRILTLLVVAAFPGRAIVVSAGEELPELVAVTTTSPGSNSSFGPFSLGFRFSVKHPIKVTALGRFDRNGSGLVADALARLYDWNTGKPLAGVTIGPDSTDELSGTYKTHYANLSQPVVLVPGTVYLLAVEVGDQGYAYDVQAALGPGLSFIDGRATPVGSSAMPAEANAKRFPIARGDAAASMSYLGPNFKYITSGIWLEVSTPTTRTIYQRDSDDRAEVPIQGTLSGRVTKVVARAVARYGGTVTEWKSLEWKQSGATYSGGLTLSSGWYDIEIRSFHDAKQVAETRLERIGVGDVFITAGQSNSANYGSPKHTPRDDRVSARTSVSVSAWSHAADPQPIATGGGGSPWSRLGDLLVAGGGAPVGFISVGVGSTRVGHWLPESSHYKNRLKPAIQSLGVNGFKAILWHQGESDSLAGTTAAEYAARLKRVIKQSRVDAGFDVPWGVALASFHPGSSDSREGRVIAAQKEVIDGDPLTFDGASTDDFHTRGYLHDTVHFNKDGLNEHAIRWQAAITKSIR